MSAGDWVWLVVSHTAIYGLGLCTALLWLPPATTSLLLGLSVGAGAALLGMLAVDLIKTARRR